LRRIVVLLYRLARARLGDDGAALTVLYLATFPMALFLQAVYNESLFLLLVLACFALAERRSWLAAGVVGGLASLTRSSGVAVLPALALLAWRSGERWRALASLCVAAVLFALYPLWLHWKTHDAFAFIHAEKAWHRHLSSAGPFRGLWQGLRSGWASRIFGARVAVDDGGAAADCHRDERVVPRARRLPVVRTAVGLVSATHPDAR
jgi:4-amino-4-deoxy-L-arabinose transferase-like glycosyltransferase